MDNLQILDKNDFRPSERTCCAGGVSHEAENLVSTPLKKASAPKIFCALRAQYIITAVRQVRSRSLLYASSTWPEIHSIHASSAAASSAMKGAPNLSSLQLPKLATDRGSKRLGDPNGQNFLRAARENPVSVPSGGRPGSENLVSGVQNASRKIIFVQDL